MGKVSRSEGRVVVRRGDGRVPTTRDTWYYLLVREVVLNGRLAKFEVYFRPRGLTVEVVLVGVVNIVACLVVAFF